MTIAPESAKNCPHKVPMSLKRSGATIFTSDVDSRNRNLTIRNGNIKHCTLLMVIRSESAELREGAYTLLPCCLGVSCFFLRNISSGGRESHSDHTSLQTLVVVHHTCHIDAGGFLCARRGTMTFFDSDL